MTELPPIAEGPAVPAAALRPDSPRAALWSRLLLAHLLSYPLLFVAALASMSLAIVGLEDALLGVGAAREPASGLQRWLMHQLGLSLGDATRFEIIVKPVALGLCLLLLVTHLGAIPWALCAAREVRARGTAEAQAALRRLARARRWWLAASLGPTALLVLAGIAGWAWIFTR